MTDNSLPTIAVRFSAPQLGCLLALIHANQDGVRLKLENADPGTIERAVLEDLMLQLRATQQLIERALTEADCAPSGSVG